MRGGFDRALGEGIFVRIVSGNECISLGKLTGRRVGSEAPAAFKGFNHASDTTIPVSPIRFDVVWACIVTVCGVTKGFEGTGGRIRPIGEEIVVRITLVREVPDLAFEDVAAKIAGGLEKCVFP